MLRMKRGRKMVLRRTRAGSSLLLGPGAWTQAVICRPHQSAKLYRRKLVRGTKYLVLHGLPEAFWTDSMLEERDGKMMMEMKKT